MEEPARGSPKFSWRGKVLSVQPRIRLLRSFDQRNHGYPGYVLTFEGTISGEARSTFAVAIGEGAQEKHAFRVGDEVSGEAVPVADPRKETAGYYKASALQVHERGEPRADAADAPPYHALAPPLTEYRRRGHRRLDARTYAAKCMTCVWGCRMPVEMIVDHWNRSRGPDNVIWRFETFCYGPKECPLYRAGPIRKVPGRKGMTHEDESDTTT